MTAIAFSPARRRPRLAKAVVEDLVMAIVTEKYASGSALPAENVLCDMFEVSRTVIREATTALTEKGLVSSQQGRGTIVLDSSHWSLLDPMVLGALFQREDGLTYLDNLIEIRVTLEASMASKAARKATGEDLGELTAQFKVMENLIYTPTDYAREDVKFHQIIMRISGDVLSEAIINIVQGCALPSSNYSGTPSDKHMQETHDAHRKIYQAIVSHDVDGAAQAMRDHIEGSWRRRRPSSLT